MIVAFWVSLVLTLVLLGLAIRAGLRGHRRAHFVLAPAAIVALEAVRSTVWLK